MAVTTKTSLGLDLIDVSTERLEDSRVKISANFQLIHNLFVSNTAYLLGAPIASASTTTIGSVGSGDTKHVTGTTTITSFGVSTTGVKKTLIFDGVLTLTHNATSLICLGNANIVTAVGDIAEFQCVDGATAKWMCTSYTRKSGQPLFVEDKLGTPIASATTTTIGTAGLGDYIHITGTTTITSFGTASTAGIRRTLIFDGVLTLTHNATSLICLGAVNLVTVAGLVVEVVAETTENWRVVSITHPSLSATELGYLDGVTSAIQTQINEKLSSSGGTMTGAITALRETKVAMVANAIDLSLGNLFTKTISAITTFTVSNVLSSGNANSFVLELTNGGAYTITWFSGVKWAGGVAPTLTASGVDILGFYSHDGGVTWRGIVMAKDSK